MATIDSSAWVAPGAFVLGDVEVGKDCGIWYNAVLRGDIAAIKIGDRTNVQDNAVIHVDFDKPAIIGNDVTIGHGAIVHGCTIGDNSLIGMGAIVLNGAEIGENCIIGAGALVTQNKKIPAGSMAFGNPAKVIRQLTQEEIDGITYNAKVYVDEAQKQRETEASE